MKKTTCVDCGGRGEVYDPEVGGFYPCMTCEGRGTIAAVTRVMIALALMLLVGAASASAQSLKVPTAVFAGAAAADWTSTYRNLRGVDGREANPTIAVCHGSERHGTCGPLTTVVLGAAIDAAGVVAWNRIVGRRHPKLAAVGLYAASAFRGYLAYRNTTHRPFSQHDAGFK